MNRFELENSIKEQLIGLIGDRCLRDSVSARLCNALFDKMLEGGELPTVGVNANDVRVRIILPGGAVVQGEVLINPYEPDMNHISYGLAPGEPLGVVIGTRDEEGITSVYMNGREQRTYADWQRDYEDSMTDHTLTYDDVIRARDSISRNFYQRNEEANNNLIGLQGIINDINASYERIINDDINERPRWDWVDHEAPEADWSQANVWGFNHQRI